SGVTDQVDLEIPSGVTDQVDLEIPSGVTDQVDLEIPSGVTDQVDLEIPSGVTDQVDLEIPSGAMDTEIKTSQDQMLQFPQEDIEQVDIPLNEEELKDMHEKSLLEEGIGSEFSEEDLAKIRESLLSYSEPLRKVIIDSVVNEKISRTDQRALTNMLIDGVDESTLLDFIEEKLGFRPKVTIDKTKEGIPIIYVDEVSPEALERKRKRAKLFLILSSVFSISIFFLFLGLKFYNYYRTTNLYELGLEELKKSEKADSKDKETYIQKAEEYFQKALKNEGDYNTTYLYKYADLYIRLGKYERAFEKLFGKIDPEYAWNSPSLRVPLIQKSTRWKNLDEIQKGYYTEFFSKDQVKRKLLIPGAFTLLKLKYDKYDKDNLIYLAKFHSLNVPHFLNSEEGKKYKNDSLAIDYYKIILTLLNKPNDPDALSGIGKIYYNQKKFSMASEEYQKIIDIYPNNIQGHDGILNTYIEIWKENKDPRYVIAKHRYLQKLGLEEDLPIYTLAKLVGFYTEIHPEELRIKYNIDPIDTLTQLSIDGNIQNLLNLIYNKKEKRGEEILLGNQYGEGFYQRGRFLFKKKEYQNSIKQFQNAYYYDFKHFPSLYYIGLYYLKHLKDYEKAKEYFLKALEVYNQYKDHYGIRPEDETMLSFNRGLIYYELVSTVFEKQKDNWIPPIVSLNEPNENYKILLREIISSEEYNELAIQELNEENKIVESIFRKGVIEYVNGNFRNALNIWLKIENSEILKSPNYFLSLGNASYYSDQKKQALNFYNQARYLLESKEKRNDLEKKMMYFVLNNLGTTYESLARENKNKLPKYKIDELQQLSLEYYYKAVEYAIQNKILPSKAKLNIDLFLKRDAEKLLLEDEILFNLGGIQ
ncbi:MAG: tetratricopeptide repeat protein, partial [Leptonema sp. (in: bacteria)]